MITYLPKSTNEDYPGPMLAAWVLGLYGVQRIVTGGIHVFLDDGGAGRIAGLPLDGRLDGARETIIGLFAWAGSTQMAWGALLLLLAWRYRSLVPLALAAAFMEQALIAFNVWLWKPTVTEPSPGAYGALILSALFAVCCAWSWRRRT